MESQNDASKKVRIIPGLRETIIKDLEALPSHETTDSDPMEFDRDETMQTVREKIEYHFGRHTASDLLFEQLVELEGNHYVTILGKKHPYRPFTVYHRIEDVIQGRKKGKRFRKSNSPLNTRDLRHVHHSENFYLDRNFIEFFKKKYPNDSAIEERLSEIHENGKVPKSNPLVYLTSEALIRSVADNPRKTGQWLIYQETQDRLHFVCLWLHTRGLDGDQQLFDTIEPHLI